MPAAESPKLWFRAKRYGLGWTPCTWQGWAAMLAFVLLLIGGTFALRRHGQGTAAVIAYALVLAVLLTAVCWRKGEPLRWRWGEHER